LPESLDVPDSTLTTHDLAPGRRPVALMESILKAEARRGHVEKIDDGWRATAELVRRHGAAFGEFRPA
jgi:hypothetical protein